MERRSLGEGRRSGGELVPEILACFCCCWCCGGAAATRAAQQETTASRTAAAAAAADGLLPAPIGLADAVLSSLLQPAESADPLTGANYAAGAAVCVSWSAN
jgi:hypothetical protein